MSGDHSCTVSVEPYGVSLRVHCHNRRDDPTRSCWPYDESGRPCVDEPKSHDCCTVTQWVDELGVDALTAERTLVFEVDEVSWVGGELEAFVLGALIGDDYEERAPTAGEGT